jgi:hypothetical protein
VLIKAIIFHLAFHLRISSILYEKIGDPNDYQFTNHYLLLIFNDDFSEKPLKEAIKGSWTTLFNELKVSKL